MTETDADGTTQRWFIYGNYIDEVLLIKADSNDYYYAQDHLYSPAALINSSGSVVERYEYDAYGDCNIMDASYNPRSSSNYGNPYLFTGRRVDFLDDGVLVLQYNRNRYYDYYTGRWLTHDPLDYFDGMNLYEYVKSNPVNSLDPNGTYEEDVHRRLTRFLAESAGFDAESCGELTPDRIGDETQLVDEDTRSPGFRRNLHIHFATIGQLAVHRMIAFQTCRPHDIGTYLHSLEDSYSHQRGTTTRSDFRSPAVRIRWHAFSGRWPDHRWERPELADRMALNVFGALRDIARQCCDCYVCLTAKKWPEIVGKVRRSNRQRR